MKKILSGMLAVVLMAGCSGNSPKEISGNHDRDIWIDAVTTVAEPVLVHMSQGQLREKMPVEVVSGNTRTLEKVTHLEALGRLVTGIAPWLELGPDDTPEGRLREKYILLTLASISNGVDPSSPDYLNFTELRQPLVDAAFLAHGLLRAPTQLWGRLDDVSKERLVKELKATRSIKPHENNWLLFSAMVECALKELTGEWEYERVEYALNKHAGWYKGDAWYGDGKDFHFDYYNSFVIHPMLMQVLDVASRHVPEVADFHKSQQKRYGRYAEQLERVISPEGTFPAVGRSLAYRFGAFHALSDVAYRQMLPEKVAPAQVRSALTAVIERQLNAPGTFDENGWLHLGFAGHQPSIAETYISTGSLYLCCAAFVALGLPADDPFWSEPSCMWTQQKVWSGVDIPCDKALKH